MSQVFFKNFKLRTTKESKEDFYLMNRAKCPTLLKTTLNIVPLMTPTTKDI